MTIQGNQIYAYEATFCAIMTLMVFARLFVRIFPRGSVFSLYAWRWSDAFIFFAWLMRMVITISDTWIVAWNGYNLDSGVVTPDDVAIKRNKLYFVGYLLYMLTFVFIKCGVLCLFAEFVPRSFQKVWVFIRVIGIIVVCHGFAFMVLFLTWCKPIQSNWDQPSHTCYISTQVLIMWFVGHIFTELLMISIPFTILHLLRDLTRAQKIVGVIMCSLGFVTIVCAVANAVIDIKWVEDASSVSYAENVAFNFIAITEPPTAICIACIPPLRLLFTRNGRRQLWQQRDDLKSTAYTDSTNLTTLDRTKRSSATFSKSRNSKGDIDLRQFNVIASETNSERGTSQPAPETSNDSQARQRIMPLEV